MNPDILRALGGVALFLLGMLILTDGLRALAGDALRTMLARMTRTPWSGALAGALATAMIRSSSATTVTAVGFVGAGLLTFPQALGVIFGANIGTTITGWVVALLGFGFDTGLVAMPLALAGVLLRLFGRGRARDVGWAFAGFWLLFIGVAAMQDGLAVFEGRITPADFPDDTFAGRLQLVLIGGAITLVTQSSSAGVATALVALAGGAIALPQAAAMVIGMDIATTFSAFLATLGGSVAMRRTGYAHVIYNVLTGTMAFALLDLFGFLSDAALKAGAGPAFLLVAFHTSFNTLGVLLVLPFTDRFAALICWLVPERGAPALRRLDVRLVSDPAAAVDAVAGTLGEIADDLCAALLSQLRGASPHGRGVADAAAALSATRAFMSHIQTTPDTGAPHLRHVAAMHALDHLDRLCRRAGQDARLAALRDDPRLARLAGLLAAALARTGERAPRALARVAQVLAKADQGYRAATIDAAARRAIDPGAALARLDAARWLQRVGWHLWRIAGHLREARAAA